MIFEDILKLFPLLWKLRFDKFDAMVRYAWWAQPLTVGDAISALNIWVLVMRDL